MDAVMHVAAVPECSLADGCIHLVSLVISAFTSRNFSSQYTKQRELYPKEKFRHQLMMWHFHLIKWGMPLTEETALPTCYTWYQSLPFLTALAPSLATSSFCCWKPHPTLCTSFNLQHHSSLSSIRKTNFYILSPPTSRESWIHMKVLLVGLWAHEGLK